MKLPGVVVTGLLTLAGASWSQTGSLFDLENARVKPNKPTRRSSAAVDAPSAKAMPYPLTESHGPVLVRVASFLGEEKSVYAEALCKELRERHGLSAYVFRYQSEYEGEMTDEEADKFEQQYNVRPRRWVPLNESQPNWVVLVGDFPSFEDKAAQRMLDRVRKLEIRSVPDRVWASESLRTWDDETSKIDREQYADSAESISGIFTQFRDRKVKQKHPLSSAMLVRNPHPKAPRQAKGLPPETANLLLEMNTSTPFSIYESKHAYTLVVAQFQGGMVVGNDKAGSLFKGGAMFSEERSPLSQAARQAISLAEALRTLGWEAYVFHGQYASLVCVGGFPEKFDASKPEYADPRARARLMSHEPEVNILREKLAKVTIGGVPLAPYAELIVTPRPPKAAPTQMAN